MAYCADCCNGRSAGGKHIAPDTSEFPKAKGKTITAEEENNLLKKITDRYTSQLSPHYAAARMWVDEIINPLDTRKIISMGIEAANHSPITKPFNVGVIQT